MVPLQKGDEFGSYRLKCRDGEKSPFAKGKTMATFRKDRWVDLVLPPRTANH